MDNNYDPGRYVRMNEQRDKIEQLTKQKEYLQRQCRKAGSKIKILEKALKDKTQLGLTKEQGVVYKGL